MRRGQKKKHPVRKFLRNMIASLLCIVIVFCAFFGVKGYQMYKEAVAEKSINECVKEIRGMEGFTSYSELPQFYIDAVISVEDHRFENHCGIDLIAIGRAVLTDIKEHSFIQGGSTITQQLAKNMLFTQEKKLERKVAEVFAALELECNYSKEDIFELYVNTSYFGNGYYGVREAADGYFGKTFSELSEYECAMLAGIPNAPSVYSPNAVNELTARRVECVLESMVKNRIISQEQAYNIEMEQ